jgi:Spore cortex protein YabQ (Spore_YabQ).
MESAASQPIIFLITIYGGMAAGAVYDVFRGIRGAVRRGRWLAALLDTLFILVLGLIVVFVLYTANMGELRLYTFVGFALGFTLYIVGLSPFISFIAARIRDAKHNRTKK